MTNILIPDWPAPKHIKAFSTTRLNGFSQSPYDSFNLAYSVGDEIENVYQNREYLKKTLNLPSDPLWLSQIHSTVIYNVDQETMPKNADGSYTTCHNKICVVMTADCLPILLCDVSGTQIAAVHAGWRGLADGVIESALDCFNHNHKNIIAWIGPGIGLKYYEVGDDVRNKFLEINSDFNKAFQAHKQAKWLANMNLLARMRLEKAGVSAIFSENLCTFADAERFFSYRRDGITGRMASLIWIADH